MPRALALYLGVPLHMRRCTCCGWTQIPRLPHAQDPLPRDLYHRPDVDPAPTSMCTLTLERRETWVLTHPPGALDAFIWVLGRIAHSRPRHRCRAAVLNAARPVKEKLLRHERWMPTPDPPWRPRCIHLGPVPYCTQPTRPSMSCSSIQRSQTRKREIPCTTPPTHHPALPPPHVQ